MIISRRKRLRLVLDGQQRLQALYIALHGTYEGKSLYFDVLSGQETQDFKEDRFLFYFLTSEEANAGRRMKLIECSQLIRKEMNAQRLVTMPR